MTTIDILTCDVEEYAKSQKQKLADYEFVAVEGKGNTPEIAERKLKEDDLAKKCEVIIKPQTLGYEFMIATGLRFKRELNNSIK